MLTYSRSALYYDALLATSGKNYARESLVIGELVDRYKRSAGRRLLDAGCGTGRHLEHLSRRFDCEGLDIDRGMLALAAERCPNVKLHFTDMIGFNLGERFDIITCLFGSIAYLPTLQRFEQTIANFARHLVPGGIAIVEPWLRPHEWEDGRVNASFADLPDMKIARMHVNRRDENVALLNFHYMAAMRDGVRSIEETHRLLILSDDQYREAFLHAGFELHAGSQVLGGRDLFVGVRGE
ncbi:MAG: class I SAM-dependent DNA methyltransferase [Candidatus Tyrphobacter sp.]